jgi:hypothetical protein
MISAVEIATNRYAPNGSGSINLYATGLEGGSDLTLGQLVIAVSIRSAAAYEAQSVVKMNTMNSDSVILDDAADWMATIADGTADWEEAKAFCTGKLGIDASTLPDSLSSYDKRMTAVAALKAKIDTMVQQQQQDMIDLQTLVNRRDVAYSASSNIVRAFGTSMSNEADNF